MKNVIFIFLLTILISINLVYNVEAKELDYFEDLAIDEEKDMPNSSLMYSYATLMENYTRNWYKDRNFKGAFPITIFADVDENGIPEIAFGRYEITRDGIFCYNLDEIYTQTSNGEINEVFNILYSNNINGEKQKELSECQKILECYLDKHIYKYNCYPNYYTETLSNYIKSGILKYNSIHEVK